MWINLLMGLAGFALCGMVIGRLLPFPEMAVLKAKYEYYAAHREEFDLIFVGSSRFYFQIIPKEFDASVGASTGAPVRSFNWGCDGAWPPEAYYLLRRILALKPHRLKWVIIEAMSIDPRLADPAHPTSRELYWHDWRHTRMALAEVRDRPALTRAHLLLFVRRLGNVGRGGELLRPLLERQQSSPEAEPEWVGQAGFRVGPSTPLTAEAEAAFLEAVEEMRRGLPAVAPAATFERALGEMVAEVRNAGAEPVFVCAPSTNRRENLSGVPGRAAYWPFIDPGKYPALYDPAVHYDQWHLNEQGAHLFTREVAARFAELLTAPLWQE